MAKSIIIQGSSRTTGNTNYFSQHLAKQINSDIVHLAEFDLRQFDYQYQNAEDDFLPLITRLITTYDLWVFSSPVYWYSMSGLMKTFFDRITDLLTEHKGVGRQLRGKSMAVLSVSNDDDLPQCFIDPFELSAGYLGMHYLGHRHAYGNEDLNAIVQERLDNFVEILKGHNV